MYAIRSYYEMLILDEPTSGVDPVARDAFWQIMIDLARQDRVTIFISTHFMNEAERCDRISLMHAGRVLVSDAPAALIAARGVDTLEEAFIGYLEDAAAEGEEKAPAEPATNKTRQKLSLPPGGGGPGRGGIQGGELFHPSLSPLPSKSYNFV